MREIRIFSSEHGKCEKMIPSIICDQSNCNKRNWLSQFHNKSQMNWLYNHWKLNSSGEGFIIIYHHWFWPVSCEIHCMICNRTRWLHQYCCNNGWSWILKRLLKRCHWRNNLTKNSQVVWSFKVTGLTRCSEKTDVIKTQQIHSTSLENLLKAKYEPQILQLYMLNIHLLTGCGKMNHCAMKGGEISEHQVCIVEEYQIIWWNSACSSDRCEQLWNQPSSLISCSSGWHCVNKDLRIQDWSGNWAPWSPLKARKYPAFYFFNHIDTWQNMKSTCDKWHKTLQSKRLKIRFQNCFKKSN